MTQPMQQPMTLRIELAHALAELAGGEDLVDVALAVDGATVGAALRALTAAHPALAPLVWRGERFNEQLVAFLNRDDVRRLQGLDTPVRAGDRLMLITAVEGG